MIVPLYPTLCTTPKGPSQKHKVASIETLSQSLSTPIQTMEAPSKPLSSVADQQLFTVLVTGANRQVLPCLPTQQKRND